MPLQFNTVPASKIQQIKKAVGRPKTGESARTKSPSLKERVTHKRTTVSLSAYGNRLFEPAMRKEKPIVVEFADFFTDNNTTRFSKDGFFAIKQIAPENRCYLFYFINPIRVTKEVSLVPACQEAIEYKSWELESEEEYIQAFRSRNYELAARVSDKSALGKARLKIMEILREVRVAEKFLAKQRQIEKEEKEWQEFFEDKHKIEDEEELNNVESVMEKENENVAAPKLESSNSAIGGFQWKSSKDAATREVEEVCETQSEKEQEKIERSTLSEVSRDVSGKKTFKFNWGR